MTVDEVLAKLKADHGAEIQEALDYETSGQGVVEFNIGINKRPQAEIDMEIKQAEMEPEALLEKLKTLEAEIASIKDGGKVVTP